VNTAISGSPQTSELLKYAYAFDVDTSFGIGIDKTLSHEKISSYNHLLRDIFSAGVTVTSADPSFNDVVCRHSHKKDLNLLGKGLKGASVSHYVRPEMG